MAAVFACTADSFYGTGLIQGRLIVTSGRLDHIKHGHCLVAM